MPSFIREFDVGSKFEDFKTFKTFFEGLSKNASCTLFKNRKLRVFRSRAVNFDVLITISKNFGLSCVVLNNCPQC